tara:strand:- start:491 stop:859 length:369 start_codon:yes stop_codon:yes gene_type:complete
MLKTDKRYEELAINVATHMASNWSNQNIDAEEDTLLLMARLMYMALEMPKTAVIVDALTQVTDEALAEIPEMVASDSDFMEVLVDELGLAISDIDFEKALSYKRKETTANIRSAVIKLYKNV